MSLRCPKCDRANGATASFCQKCGAPLGAATEDPSIKPLDLDDLPGVDKPHELETPADAAIPPDSACSEAVEAGVAAAADSPRGYYLEVVDGACKGKRIPVEAGHPLVLGSEETTDACITGDPRVSRHHARLVVHEDRIVVRDLGSTNGTYILTHVVDVPREACEGDLIRLGNTFFRVKQGA